MNPSRKIKDIPRRLVCASIEADNGAWLNHATVELRFEVSLVVGESMTKLGRLATWKGAQTVHVSDNGIDHPPMSLKL